MRHIRTLRFITLLILSVVSTSIIVARTNAQSPSPESATPTAGLTVTPPTFEINGNAGETIKNTIRVDNLNDFSIKLAVDRRNFTAIGEEGAVGLTEEETSFSLASWIEVSPQEITIPAKSSQVFSYTITIPLTAEPGGHFGSLVFRTVPTENIQGSGASLAQEIGSLVLLRIAGTSQEEANLVSFATEKSLYEYGPVTFHTRVENTGNVHLKPTGTITITNTFGQQVASVPLDSRNILPGATRRLDTNWDTHWRMGRYTASVVMVYGRDTIQRAAVTNFYVIPYKVVAGILAITLFFFFILYRSRKRLFLALRILFTGKS